MKSIFSVTSTQKALDYLTRFPGTQFIAGEIQGRVKISKGGLNQSLRELVSEGIVRREKRGKIFLYSINHANLLVKQFKILKNIELLYPLLKKIGVHSEKVILFGSSSRGEDSIDSDIDLLIVTRSPDVVHVLLQKVKTGRKIQEIVRMPVSFADMEKKEPVFYEEINRGIILWENKR
jgi:predicted nucleotidyltransferase